MLNDENKKKLKEILMSNKKMSEEEIDKLINEYFIEENQFSSGFFALLILAFVLLTEQPKEVVIPPININVNYGDEE